jgi:hypothetical protein
VLIDAARGLARAAAGRVVADLAMLGPAPEAAVREAVPAALLRFTDGVIARMIPVAALLRRAMPSPAGGG